MKSNSTLTDDGFHGHVNLRRIGVVTEERVNLFIIDQFTTSRRSV